MTHTKRKAWEKANRAALAALGADRDKDVMSDSPPRKNWYRWTTLGGETFEGEVVDVDSNVLYVKCTDGATRCVEC